MISSSSLLESRLNSSTTRSDPDTEAKVRSTIRSLNDSLQSNANEPSLAFYRIQVKIFRCVFFLFIIDHGNCRNTFEKLYQH